MSYFKNPEKVEGGQRKLWTSEDNVEDILGKILEELRILNMNIAILTEQEITKEDLE